MSRFDNEKAIMNMNMAAYLVLCGCKLNKTRIDMLNRSRFVYFFEDNKWLGELMDLYPKYREQLYQIGNESLDNIRSEGVQKTDERV